MPDLFTWGIELFNGLQVILCEEGDQTLKAHHHVVEIILNYLEYL